MSKTRVFKQQLRRMRMATATTNPASSVKVT